MTSGQLPTRHDLYRAPARVEDTLSFRADRVPLRFNRQSLAENFLAPDGPKSGLQLNGFKRWQFEARRQDYRGRWRPVVNRAMQARRGQCVIQREI
jgi:hypothetical protein